MSSFVSSFTRGAASGAVQEIVSAGHAVQAGRQLVDGMVKRVQEIYQDLGSDIPEKKLDNLLTSAIATKDWEAFQEKFTLLKQFEASLPQDQTLPEAQQERLKKLLEEIENKTDLNQVIGLLIKAQKEIADHAAASLLQSKVQKVAKAIFCDLSKSFVRKLEEKLPDHVYRSMYQKICECEVNSALSLKDAVQKLLTEVDGTPEICCQSFNVTASLRDFLTTFLKESDQLPSVEEERYLDTIDEMPSPSPEELKKMVQDQKNAFIQDTNLFLIFTITHYFCVPPNKDSDGNIIPMDPNYYVNLLAAGKSKEEKNPNETTASYLKNDIIAAAAPAGRAYKTAVTCLVWWFASKIVPFFVSNLFNHHFDAFYNEYIASKEGSDASNRKLFDLIVSRFGCYFSVLNGAYDRVRREVNVEGEVSHHLAKELDRPCVYGNMSLNELYARFISHELSVGLRGDILAKLANFMITPLISLKLAPRITGFLGSSFPARVTGFALPVLLCWQLVPKLIDLSSFVVMKLFSWQLAPKLVNFIDTHISSQLTSKGYPHGINLILKKKLEGLKDDLEQPSGDRQGPLASIPLSEREPIKSCIENLLYALSNNRTSSIPELQKGYPLESDVYSGVATQVAYVAAQLIQDLSRGRQVEQFFLELMQNLNKFYAISSKNQFEAAEAKVDGEVKALAQKITHLYLKKFIEDLDLSGENRRAAFQKIIQNAKESIRDFAESQQRQVENWALVKDLSNLENLKKQIETALENTNIVNEPLENRRSYVLMAEHKPRLKAENDTVRSIKGQLLEHLGAMKTLALEAKMKQMLLPIKHALESLQSKVSNESCIESNILENAEQTVKTCEITIFHEDWLNLDQASQEFEKNRKDKTDIEGFLKDLSSNKAAALHFLDKQSSIMNPLAIRALRSDRAILMQEIPNPSENLAQSSIFKRSLMAIGLKLGLIAEPVTPEMQTASLKNIKMRLESQLQQRQRVIGEKKTKICNIISYINQKIDQKLATFKQNPPEAFEMEKTAFKKELQKLQAYEEALQKPIFYSHIVITNKKITDIVFYLIEIPGLTVRYIDSITSLFSKKETYRVLLPQAVLRHIVE